MHALHRSHLNRAVTATIVAAALAIIVSLVIAASLSDLGSTSAPASVPSQPAAAAAVRLPEVRPSLRNSPFTFSATPFTSADFFTGQEVRKWLARSRASESRSQAHNDG